MRTERDDQGPGPEDRPAGARSAGASGVQDPPPAPAKRSAGVGGSIYCFGDFRFIPDRQMLLHGEERLHVGSRALDLLRQLVTRAGEVVSKDELMGAAWPATFVHAGNLKVNIAALRRALAQAAGAGLTCIATVPGRGYRFVAPVRVYGGEQELRLPGPARAGSGALPREPALIGRDDVLAEVEGRLRADGFLTIVGAAGIGKTTVAAAAAKRLAGHYGDGVRFIDLAAIGDPQLVAPAIAAALGIGGKWTDMLAGIVEALRDREMLLLIDNCEHVLSTASSIAEHLRLALPAVHIIATSREPLRSRSESIYRLPPLPCPDEESDGSPAAVLAFPAVELFVRRAGEAHGYRLDAGDAPAVAAICRRLDGIALAIELAASRLQTSDPATLLALLERSFEPLDAGALPVAPRHRTLLATLDWSYRLLSRDEARLLRLLSVFTAAFALDDVIGVATHLGRQAEDIAGWTESLVAKSLLAAAYGAGGPRYRLLDSTRSFAAGKLQASGEGEAAMTGYARHVLALFEQAEAEWHWRARQEWTAAYAWRANDVRKAIDWAFGAGGDPLTGVRLTSAAIPFWDELSSVGESRLRVERALQAADALARCNAAVRMKLVASYASGLNFSEHLGPEAEAAWREGHHLACAIGDVDYQLRTLWGLGILQSFTGCHRQALATLRQFAGLARREDERSALADGERVRLMAAFYCGDVGEAHRGLWALAQERGAVAKPARVARFQVDGFVSVRVALATAAWVAGDHRHALAVLQEALDRCAALGHLVSQANALAQAALPIALWAGERELARRHVATLARNLTLREIAIWQPVCRFYEGTIASADGNAEGVAAMQAAVAQLVAGNFLVRVPAYLAMLAEAALRHGRSALARDCLAAAFDRAERQDEHWSRPELLRVRGLVLSREGDAAAAEEALVQARADAATSGARFFELRAAVALAELWVEAGRGEAAADMLARACAGFEGALEPADVVRARDLLRSLEAERRRSPEGSTRR